MHAIEFETKVNKGIINIPEKYIKLINGKIRIIILKSEDLSFGIQDRAEIIKLLNKIRNKGIFDKIDDPVKWQKECRNEWERSTI